MVRYIHKEKSSVSLVGIEQYGRVSGARIRASVWFSRGSGRAIDRKSGVELEENVAMGRNDGNVTE